MMRVAIMQPYLFPYLGYFQLMQYADRFLLLDDVNYLKKGWINRNRILLNHNEYRFTLPLKEVSQHKRIIELEISADDKWRRNFLETLKVAYRRAPFYDDVIGVIHHIIFHGDMQLAGFLFNSLNILKAYMSIDTEIIPVSSLNVTEGLKGQDRIIDLCVKSRATEYINLPGGKTLYSASAFSKHNIQLGFIEPGLTPYNQGQATKFFPGLSIIDVMMNNSLKTIGQMLGNYTIVSE